MPVGTLVLPDPSQVLAGVGYGANGTEFTGTFVCQPPVPPIPPLEPFVFPPSRILAAYFILTLLASDPDDEAGQLWPVYTDREPDRPDDLIKITETQGRDSGYTQISSGVNASERQEMPGLQVMVRGTDTTSVYQKIRVLQYAVDEVRRAYIHLNSTGSVVIPGTPPDTGTGTGTGPFDVASTYIIDSIARTTNVICLGRDTPQGKRVIYVFNCICSIRHCW